MTALQQLDHDDSFAAACSLWQLCNSLIMMKALKQFDHDDCFKTAWSWWQLCSCLIMMTAFNSWMMMTASQQRDHNDSLATAWSWWQLCNKLNMMTALQQIDHNDSFAVACHHDQAVVKLSSSSTLLQLDDNFATEWWLLGELENNLLKMWHHLGYSTWMLYERVFLRLLFLDHYARWSFWSSSFHHHSIIISFQAIATLALWLDV